MHTIRSRLSFNYLYVLILGMSLAAALAWLAVERMYIETQRENLLAQARLIATALQGSTLPTQAAQPYSQTTNVAPGIHTRLLSEGGAVVVELPLADAFAPAPAAEQSASIPSSELLRRPEVHSALQGIPATAIRRVLDRQRVLYAAVPIQAEAGQITGIVYIATPLPATGLPASMVWQLVAVLLVAILLAAFAGNRLARKIAHPLEDLAGATSAISQGDLDQRVHVESNIIELNSLKHAFNNMVENLRRSDQAKKAFIADVTHELRTPLTVIKGTVETLEDGALDDAEGRGALLTSMARETERLIRLVNDLLVLTRADAGSLQLNLQPLDLAQLAGDRCQVFFGLATRRGVALNVTAYPGAPQVAADVDRLAQVIDNLLDNAIRHSPENTTVRISIEPVDGGVQCSVCDRGPGIPVQHLPLIFERFYRVDSSRTRKDGGTGLGLAIARALVIAQDGEIRARSVEGSGTTISFWLPASDTASFEAEQIRKPRDSDPTIASHLPGS